MESTLPVKPLPAPSSKPRVAPGPKGCILFGSVAEMRRDQIATLMNAARDYGDIVRLNLVRYVHLLNHPDHVKHVLLDRNTNYEKDFMYQRLRPVVGNGLLTSNGSFWRRQRRLAQPAFHKQRLAGFADTMVMMTGEMLDAWRPHVTSGNPFDVAPAMMGLALRIVGKTLFSADLSGEASTVGDALTVALHVTNERMQSIFVLPGLPTRTNRKFNRAMATLDEIVYDVIEARRSTSDDPGDLLSMLMHTRDDETGESMDDHQLRDELMTIFLAGHETTANNLSWTWYLLSKHPEIERRLHDEVERVLAGRTPTLDDLPKLQYTRMVIDEALRLYPPAWIYSRSAIEEDEIGGYQIPAESQVMISPYVLHRHPGFWDNPEGFDPDRFAPDRTAARPRFAYVPFAAGPRQCIGNNFALMEATIIIAMIAQRYRLQLVPGQKVEPEPQVTLRPRDGVLVTLKLQT